MKANWKDIAELVGVAAIVASLVFVGIQMQQSHDIAASQIYQERANASVAAIMAAATNPELVSAFSKTNSGQSVTHTDAERTAALMAISGFAQLWDNAHYQYEQGYLSQSGWYRVRSDIKSLLRNPNTRSIILAFIESGQARPKLASVYKEIIAELDNERSE